MSDPLALKALLASSPKSHHPSIRQAFEIGKGTARISFEIKTREALRSLFQIADMDVENEPS